MPEHAAKGVLYAAHAAAVCGIAHHDVRIEWHVWRRLNIAKQVVNVDGQVGALQDEIAAQDHAIAGAGPRTGAGREAGIADHTVVAPTFGPTPSSTAQPLRRINCSPNPMRYL